jgi:hypothetical protein
MPALHARRLQIRIRLTALSESVQHGLHHTMRVRHEIAIPRQLAKPLYGNVPLHIAHAQVIHKVHALGADMCGKVVIILGVSILACRAGGAIDLDAAGTGLGVAGR